MYTSFYNLAEMPFGVSSDPRFLWTGHRQKEALTALRAALIEDDGFVVLTGDVGTGKTTLVNALLRSLDSSVRVADICHPTLSSNDFYNLIAHAYGVTEEITSKPQFLLFIITMLQQYRRDGRSVLLVIDEAHYLPEELFEELRLLSTIEEEGNRLLSILFVGQQGLKEILHRPRHSALCQRVKLFYEVEPLSEQETLEYVAHRLKVAGADGPLFSPAAVSLVHSFSGGCPRLINTLCGRALMAGSAGKQLQIDTPVVEACIEEMRLSKALPPSPQTQRAPEPAVSLPALPQVGGGSDPAVIQMQAEGISHHDRLTAGNTLKAFLQHGLSKRLHFPAAALTLMVLFAVAAIIGRQIVTDDSTPSGMQVQQQQARDQREGPPGSQPLAAMAKATEAGEGENVQTTNDTKEAYGTEKEADMVQRLAESAALVGQAEQVSAANPEQALSLLQRAVELDPGNSRAYFRRGKIYTELKVTGSAIAAYRQALNLDPDYADALYNLGFVYATVGRYADAEQFFARVVRLEPGYLDKALFNLAVVQEKLGKNEESLANLHKAASLSPQDQKIRGYLQKMTAAGEEGS